MASTAHYLGDDFRSYLDTIEPSTDHSSTTTLLEYPDPQSVAGINPSSLTYNAYPGNFSHGFSFPSAPSRAHSFGSSATRSNMYGRALNVVLQTSSTAPSNSPSVGMNLPSEPKFAGPDGKEIKSRSRRNTGVRSSHRKSSTLSISSQSNRSRKKQQIISGQETSADVEEQPHDDDDDDDDDDVALSDDGDPSKTRRERALERNRLAASKCREKKKAYHQELEARARRLGEEREELINTVKILQDQLFTTKSRFLEHVDCGCTGIREYMKSTVRPMTAEGMALYQALEHYAANDMKGGMLLEMAPDELVANGRLSSEAIAALGIPNAADMCVDQFQPQNGTGG